MSAMNDRPVPASAIAPTTDKTTTERAGEVARRAVTQKKNSGKHMPPSVRKARVTEVVLARLADKGIGDKP